MLETYNLTYKYPNANPIFFPDILCDSGSSLLILGDSGVGKSTLLHMLGGLMKPTAGNIKIAGTDITALENKSLDNFRGEHIGIIFQKTHFISSLNVMENLAFTRSLSGQKVDKKHIRSLLDRLAIPHKIKNKPSELSQGEMQRLSIARALVTNPSIILADEPTSALDDANCNRVIELLQEQAKNENASLIIVTHDQRISEVFSEKIVLTSKNQA